MNVKFRLSAIWLVLGTLLFCAPVVFAEAPPAATPYTIDYQAETLHFDDTKYTLTDADGVPLKDKEGAPLGDNASLSDFIVTKNSGDEPKRLILTGKDAATENVTVPIPTRPAAPALVPDWKAGATLGIYKKSFRYWYTIDADEDLAKLAPIKPLTCLEKPIPLTASATDSTLHVQLAAVPADAETGTTPAFASAIASLKVLALRDAPPDTLVKIEGTPSPDTITVTALADAEYCAVQKNDETKTTGWKSLAELTGGQPAGSNPVLAGLTPGTEYNVKVRYAAVANAPDKGITGELPSKELVLTATTQKAGSLKIVPTDAEGKPFAGLAYEVFVPVDFAENETEKVISYPLDTARMEKAHGLVYVPAEDTANAPTLEVKLFLNEDGTVRCDPAEWQVPAKPTIDFTTQSYSTAVKFVAADGSALPDGVTSTAEWKYTRVGDVLYGDLGSILPAGYRMAATDKQTDTAVALQLYYVEDAWKALPENGLTLTIELIATPTPSPSATPTAAPTETPAETPTPAPTETPTAAPTETPTAAPTDSGDDTNDSPPAPTTAPTAVPTEKPTAAPTVVPAPAPAPAPVTDPTAGRLLPGKTTASTNKTQQGLSDTTFTAKPESTKPSATPTASPTPSPKPTPSPTERPSATPPEDATPEDSTNTDSPTGKTPAWLYVLLLAMAGGGLYALWFVMFHLPKKREAEFDLFKSDKSKNDRKDDE